MFYFEAKPHWDTLVHVFTGEQWRGEPEETEGPIIFISWKYFN